MKKRSVVVVVLLFQLLAAGRSAGAADYDGIKTQKLLVTSTTASGQHHSYLCTDQPEVTSLIVDLPPGAETGWHTHGVPVYGYVLAGTITVSMNDGSSFAFKQGAAIVEVQNVAHNGRNLGSDPVRLVVFYTGEVGRPNVTRVEKPATSP